jgi:hypothetical protein
MNLIHLTCQTCQKVYELEKTSEIPAHVFTMKCNWCPVCEDTADDYYEEWWDEKDNEKPENAPIPVPDNQLCFPFIMEELGINEVKPSLQTS